MRRRASVLDNAEDGVVVGFRAAAGEYDLLRPRADQGGDFFPSSLDGGSRPLAKGVDGGGVAVLTREIGKHGVEHRRLNGRRGIVVEVDTVHTGAFSIGPSFAQGKDAARGPWPPVTPGGKLELRRTGVESLLEPADGSRRDRKSTG